MATGIEDYDAKVMLAMTSIASQIIDPPSVEVAKKLEDWPQWQALIENELNIHKRLGTRELATPPPIANILGRWIVLCYKLGKDRKCQFDTIEQSKHMDQELIHDMTKYTACMVQYPDNYSFKKHTLRPSYRKK